MHPRSIIQLTMIAIAILLGVTVVASAPLGATDFNEPEGLQRNGKGGWGYFTYTPAGNLGYTVMYNKDGQRSALGRLPVPSAPSAGLQPYGMTGFPSNGLGYFVGSQFPAHYQHDYQDPSYFPSRNYDSQGIYETKSDFSKNEEVEDLRQSSTPRPVINTIVSLNRMNIMRLALRNAMMLMLG